FRRNGFRGKREIGHRVDRGGGRVEIDDLEIALVRREGEDPLDVLASPGGTQGGGPADIALAGHEVCELRQTTGVRRQPERAELAQLLEEEQRILAGEHLGARPEADRKRPLAGASIRGLFVETHRCEIEALEITGVIDVSALLLVPDQLLEISLAFVTVA